MKEATQTNWHELPANQVAAALESDSGTGLAAGEVEARLQQFGPNQMTAKWHELPLCERLLADYSSSTSTK